mmetsp:Transcript_124395/g.323200  ORF Transcript_124395/g.323200 Transcript_124395/m.323200 type:complete len:173 (-) Transcript_124395:119-637(-)
MPHAQVCAAVMLHCSGRELCAGRTGRTAAAAAAADVHGQTSEVLNAEESNTHLSWGSSARWAMMGAYAAMCSAVTRLPEAGLAEPTAPRRPDPEAEREVVGSSVDPNFGLPPDGPMADQRVPAVGAALTTSMRQGSTIMFRNGKGASSRWQQPSRKGQGRQVAAMFLSLASS